MKQRDNFTFIYIIALVIKDTRIIRVGEISIHVHIPVIHVSEYFIIMKIKVCKQVIYSDRVDVKKIF